MYVTLIDESSIVIILQILSNIFHNNVWTIKIRHHADIQKAEVSPVQQSVF